MFPRLSTHTTNLFIKFQGSSFNGFFRYFADRISSIIFQRAITRERIHIGKIKDVSYFFHRESI